MVKILNKQTCPYNDIQISDWLFKVMPHIIHMQPGIEKRSEWYGVFMEKKTASSLKCVLTVLSPLIPWWLPGEN